MHAIVVNSPIGRLHIAADERGICGVRLLGGDEVLAQVDTCALLEEARVQLEQYFAGCRSAFDLPLHAAGTVFERQVWSALERIPYGETRTYGQIAAQLGRPSAARAVGRACLRNPLLILVPCHRVIASLGSLTGFAAGLPAKRYLLAHEGFSVNQDVIRKKER